MNTEMNTESIKTESIKDFLGKEITIGCRIVYPGRQGSKLWMSKAQVQKIEDGALFCIKSDGRPVKIVNIANCVVVEL